MSDIYIIKLTDRQTKKNILAHNKSWQANCQKPTEKKTINSMVIELVICE